MSELPAVISLGAGDEDRRQEIVGYVDVDPDAGEVQGVELVVQAAPGPARRAAAALIAAGLAAAEELGDENVKPLLAEYDRAAA